MDSITAKGGLGALEMANNIPNTSLFTPKVLVWAGGPREAEVFRKDKAICWRRAATNETRCYFLCFKEHNNGKVSKFIEKVKSKNCNPSSSVFVCHGWEKLAEQLRNLGWTIVEYSSADNANFRQLVEDFKGANEDKELVEVALRWLFVFLGGVARDWACYFRHRVAGAFAPLVASAEALSAWVAEGFEDGVVELLRELGTAWQERKHESPGAVLERVRVLLFGQGELLTDSWNQPVPLRTRVGTTFTEVVSSLPKAQREVAARAWYSVADFLGGRVVENQLQWRADCWIANYCSMFSELAADPEGAIRLLARIPQGGLAGDVVAASLSQCSGWVSLAKWLEELVAALDVPFRNAPDRRAP